MNTETTATVIETPAAETVKPRILVHVRSEDDKKILTENFAVDKLGKPSYVIGLMGDARMALVKAAAAGVKIYSTGLPTDLLSDIGGEVTILRCWAKVKDDGSKSSGSMPPTPYFAGKIHSQTAYDALKANPLFAQAFQAPEEDENAEGADLAGF